MRQSLNPSKSSFFVSLWADVKKLETLWRWGNSFLKHKRLLFQDATDTSCLDQSSLRSQPPLPQQSPASNEQQVIRYLLPAAHHNHVLGHMAVLPQISFHISCCCPFQHLNPVVLGGPQRLNQIRHPCDFLLLPIILDSSRHLI